MTIVWGNQFAPVFPPLLYKYIAYKMKTFSLGGEFRATDFSRLYHETDHLEMKIHDGNGRNYVEIKS